MADRARQPAYGRAGGLWVETSVPDVPARQVSIAFGPPISRVAVMNPDGSQATFPGTAVTLTLRGGEGRLLLVNP